MEREKSNPPFGHRPRQSDEKPAAPLLLKVPEVASLLRTTSTAVYNMHAKRQIPGAVRIGRRLLFSYEALLNWVDQNRAPSPKER